RPRGSSLGLSLPKRKRPSPLRRVSHAFGYGHCHFGSEHGRNLTFVCDAWDDEALVRCLEDQSRAQRGRAVYVWPFRIHHSTSLHISTCTMYRPTLTSPIFPCR